VEQAMQAGTLEQMMNYLYQFSMFIARAWSQLLGG